MPTSWASYRGACSRDISHRARNPPRGPFAERQIGSTRVVFFHAGNRRRARFEETNVRSEMRRTGGALNKHDDTIVPLANGGSRSRLGHVKSLTSDDSAKLQPTTLNTPALSYKQAFGTARPYQELPCQGQATQYPVFKVKSASKKSTLSLVGRHSIFFSCLPAHTGTMVDFILGLGLSLPIVTTTGISTVTGVAQGVQEQKKQNADSSNQARMMKFHLDVFVEPTNRKGRGGGLNGGIITLRDDKLWVDDKSPITRQPKDVAHHPFTGFYLAYPDGDRPYTRGLVSTISRDPPVLNWMYIDKDTLEVKYASRSGSIMHHVGSYDWTKEGNDDSCITFDDWEGFLAVEEAENQWALYFDLNDDGLKAHRKRKKTCEVSLVRRIISDQEVNKWGLKEDGNIGFRATKEVDKISERRQQREEQEAQQGNQG